MRYISVFSGIEAASVAWESLGWEPVAFSEIDEFPSAVLAVRYPDVPNLGDITKVDWTPYRGTVDLVVGGSPCQAFSVAGKREGLLDARGQLMLEYVRAVAEIEPRWFIWENVPGALSQDRGRAFGTLLREMDELGYSCAWRVLDAQFFGVAQRRRRVFLVGCAGGGGGAAAAVLFEPESVSWNTQTSKQKREALAADARSGPAGAESGVTAFAQNTRDEVRVQGDGTISGALAAQPGMKQQTYVAEARAYREIPFKCPVCGAEAVVSVDDSQEPEEFWHYSCGCSNMGCENYVRPRRSFSSREDAIADWNGYILLNSYSIDYKQTPKFNEQLCHTLTHEGDGGIHSAVAYSECLTPWDVQSKRGSDGDGVADDTLDTTGPEAVAYAVRMRAGCAGGGKGALVQEGVSGTLATGNDQTIFQPVDSHHIEQGEDADSAQTLQIDENPNIMPVVLTQYGEEIAGTLRARYDSSPTPDNGQNAVVQPMVMASGHSHAEIGVGGIVPTLTAHNSKDAPILAASSNVIAMADDNGKTAVDVDMCGSLKVGGAPPSIAIQGDGTRSCGSQNGSGISGDGTSYTLNTIDRHSVMQPGATNGYVVRRLTPTECERLQGFPDGWTDIGEWTDSKGKKRKTTDGNRYKALGNSFAVPVVRWLGERIERIMMIEAGNNYRKARMAAEVKAERAATELGVSITTLFSWERGDTKPNGDNICAMAKLYGVSADYLLGLDA